ncbi:MAG: hypothetical protein ACRDAO_05675 [Culicoidibacterales bacterium]
MSSKLGFLGGVTIFLLLAVPMFLEINKTQVTASAVQQLAQEIVVLTETEGGMTSRVSDVIHQNKDHYAKTKMNLDIQVVNESGVTLTTKEAASTTFQVQVNVRYQAWFKENNIKSSASGIIMKR